MGRYAQDFHHRFPETVADWARELGVDPELVADGLAHYNWAIRFCLENEATPAIQLGKMGTLRLDPRATRAGISSVIKRYRRGELTREYACGYIRRVWPLMRRAQAYSNRVRHRHILRHADTRKEGWEQFYQDVPHKNPARWRELSPDRKGYRKHIQEIKESGDNP